MTRALRIALVVDPFRLKRKGGDHAAAVARELLGRGHTVRGFGAPPGAIPRSGSEPPDGAEEGAGIVGFRPDIIVAYDALSPAAWNAARRASKLHVPLILVEEAFPERGRRIERALRWVGERLWGVYVRRKAHGLIALDCVARDQAIAEGFAPSEVLVIPAGVDLARYRPGLSSHIPSSHGIRGRVLLHLGRIDQPEDLDILVQAFAASVGRRGDWALLIASDGPLRTRARVVGNRLGVGAQVHWIAPPRREELPGLLGASTLYVAPSLRKDITGWRVRRALACGLPVIAGAGPRAEELIENDGNGMVVATRDVDAWSEALRTASGAPERRRRWGLRAREVAEERYSWADIAERIESVLLDACARSLAKPLPPPEPVDESRAVDESS